MSDDTRLLKSIQQSVASAYNFFTASSVREAHNVLVDFDIHVVLVSQKMTGMSGLQFCESISHEFPGLKNIILNNTEATSSLENAHRAGKIFRFVEAPFSSVKLRMTIDNALNLHKATYEKKQLAKELSKNKQNRQDILDLFKRYVPGEVVSQALNTAEEDIMKPGESRVVSVLFADMRDFTTLTSQLPPSEVVTFLNDYWDTVTAAVKENKGSVNKYIGDGLLAVFGAPVSYIDNHENAVHAALDMVDSLDEINKQYADKLGSKIEIGIGINSGEVIVGNVGTNDFMEYTVIGNTVNVASRLEAMSKGKPNSIIISKHTYELVKHAFRTSKLTETSLPNGDEMLSFCEVLGRNPDNIFPMNPQSNIQ